jgi:hypothetical protein
LPVCRRISPNVQLARSVRLGHGLMGIHA